MRPRLTIDEMYSIYNEKLKTKLEQYDPLHEKFNYRQITVTWHAQSGAYYLVASVKINGQVYVVPSLADDDLTDEQINMVIERFFQANLRAYEKLMHET